MKTVITSVLLIATTTASAGNIYRCGNEYTDNVKLCNNKVELSINSTPPLVDDRVAAVTRYYEDKLALQAIESNRREFELTKAYLQSPRVTQTTNVTSISSASASAGIGYGGHDNKKTRE